MNQFGQRTNARPLAEFAEACSGTTVSISKYILEWLGKLEFKPTGSGAGLDGWDIDVLCNDSQAQQLCALAQADLRDFLDTGALVVKLRFRDWCFPDLTLERAKSLLAS